LIKKNQAIAAVIFFVFATAAAGVYVAAARNLRLACGHKVVMEIDYGGNLPLREAETVISGDMTVLAALQAVADVKTHCIGKYVFVVSIDGVEGARGRTAWYYTLDGKDPGELAYSKVVGSTSRVRWSYREDVCSGKVDRKTNEPAGKEEEKK